ncbi:YybH family protein [Prescottella subtropica]|uniref:YybH family protein n=1 Tax=Prescottella subtropica TaxID=2545757 RepID=UPI0010F92CE2|nr:nuclear transport factor 2 family protein [Prescottella subtropica]
MTTDRVDVRGATTPAQLAELFTAYFNGRDLDALVGLYESTALFCPSPGETDHGTDAIRRSLGAMMDVGATITLELRRIHEIGDVAVLSNDAVVTVDGRPAPTMTTEVVRRQSDGTWRYVLDDPFFSL